MRTTLKANRQHYGPEPGDEPVSLGLVVPCFNEEEVMPTFFETVPPKLDRATRGSWQIIFVDDGSTDGTAAAIINAHLRDSRITGVRLSRNFGHQPALTAGLAYARGEYIGIIDCDLQDPVDVLIELYQRARREHLDVCYGIRSRRDAPFYLNLGYSLFYKVIERLADHAWPRDAGDFCVMAARCHRMLLSLPEHSRMLRGLRSWVGLKQAGIGYHRPARLHGQTKYSIGKLCALALHGLLAFSSIPLRLAITIGIFLAGATLLFGVVVAINRFFPAFSVLGYWVGANPGITTLLCFLAVLFSVLFLCLGVVGEYLVVLLQEIKQRPTAIIESIVGNLDKNSIANQVVDLPSLEPQGTFARAVQTAQEADSIKQL